MTPDKKEQQTSLPAHIILKRNRLRAKKGLGQNFLEDRQAADQIVASAGIKPDETVVEIGAGLGALTFPLVRTGAKIIALEKDRALAAVLKDRLGKKYRDQVEIVVTDALQFDLASLGPGVVVVGNLPYQISSPLIFKLIQAGQAVDRAVLTLQKELADRIASPPGPKAYGIISVMVQLKAKVEPVLTLPASAFHPPPKVESQAIRLIFGQPPPLPIDNEETFNKLVRAAFGQRRKTLRQALRSAPLGLEAEGWEQAFQAAGVDPKLRAEKLSVAQFIALANAVAK